MLLCPCSNLTHLWFQVVQIQDLFCCQGLHLWPVEHILSWLDFATTGKMLLDFATTGKMLYHFRIVFHYSSKVNFNYARKRLTFPTLKSAEILFDYGNWTWIVHLKKNYCSLLLAKYKLLNWPNPLSMLCVSGRGAGRNNRKQRQKSCTLSIS